MMVSVSDAIVDEDTVVVKLRYAAFANAAVF